MAAGRRRAQTDPWADPLLQVLLRLAGITVGCGCWWLLVRVAVATGSAARADGSGTEWALTVVTSVVAASCLLVALLLVEPLWSEILGEDYRPRRSTGRHR